MDKCCMDYLEGIVSQRTPPQQPVTCGSCGRKIRFERAPLQSSYENPDGGPDFSSEGYVIAAAEYVED